ncbi:MAG: 7TM-DISM domain-containing protein [Leptospiraceae bacterium]|nr:7TM-DISM domain-containing protein [Leptospiraceae bacterium]
MSKVNVQQFAQITAISLLIFIPFAIYSDSIELPSKVESLLIGKEVLVFEDMQGTMTINDILAGRANFRESTSDTLNFGLTSSAYWIQFEIQNTNPNLLEYLIEISHPHIDSIRLFYIKDNQINLTYEGGDSLSFKERSIKHRNFFFLSNTDMTIKI